MTMVPRLHGYVPVFGNSVELYTICSLTSAPEVKTPLDVHLTVRLGIKYEENHFLFFPLVKK